jgi:lipid A 4'-phosphatase
VHFIFYAALKRNHRSKTLAILSLYLMLASLIGPGITVNYLFKEKIGRARPKEIQTFGGEKIFTKAAQMTDQCEHNCSFSSGHAAMGYYFTALAYAAILHSKLTKKKQLLELGENNAKPAAKRFNLIYSVFLVFGSLVGFSRVVMGGHFISDVSASCCAVLLINHLCYLLCQRLLCRKF